MSAAEQRPMCFEIRPVADDGTASRWQWTVYSHPHFAVLRDGQIVGDGAKAERAARAAVASMGGTIRTAERGQG